MGFAVTTIIQNAQTHFCDLNSTNALSYLNDINSQLQQYIRLNPESEIQIGLTANVGTYAFPSDVFLIKEPNYAENLDSQSPTKLWFTNTDFLDANFPSWRWTAEPGTPVYCYVDSTNIGFWPIPSITTVGVGTQAVPVVNLYVTQINSAPFTLSSFIPSIIPSQQIFTYGICKLWAAAYHPDKVAFFTSLYETEYNRLFEFVNNIEIRDKPTVIFRMPRIQTS